MDEKSYSRYQQRLFEKAKRRRLIRVATIRKARIRKLWRAHTADGSAGLCPGTWPMSAPTLRRAMKPYGLRTEDGRLILLLSDEWNGKPCFTQFPQHVQDAVRDAPLIKNGIHLEALLTSQVMGGDVFKAVHDDMNCLIATRLMVEKYPMDPLTRAAALAFSDFNGGAPSPLDDMMSRSPPDLEQDEEEEMSL